MENKCCNQSGVGHCTNDMEITWGQSVAFFGSNQCQEKKLASLGLGDPQARITVDFNASPNCEKEL